MTSYCGTKDSHDTIPAAAGSPQFALSTGSASAKFSSGTRSRQSDEARLASATELNATLTATNASAAKIL
jgi:hypothetical protein